MTDTLPAGASAGLPVSIDDVRAARERIEGMVRRTPMARKEALVQRFGVPVYLKAEHLQRTGSFKLRGAMNLMAQLNDDERARGVVAASAGNHAQGVAVAASEHGVKARIFMPEDASLSKLEATQNYGADVVLEGDSFDAALQAALDYADRTGATFVHPFDDTRIVAGAGTLGLEILEQIPDLATLIVPIGGGGLFSGLAIAIKEQRPDVRMVGVQVDACASLAPSLHAGKPVPVRATTTMADGIAVKQPGALNLRVIEQYLDQLVIVDDDHISQSMLWLIERAKQVVEGSGACSLAALQSGEIDLSGPTVCLLSGGNIDPMQLMPVIRHGLTTVGRFVTIWTTIPDRPGELSRLLGLIAMLKVNILAVEHHREGVDMAVGDTRVDLTLQTRNREHVAEVCGALEAAGYRTGGVPGSAA